MSWRRAYVVGVAAVLGVVAWLVVERNDRGLPDGDGGTLELARGSGLAADRGASERMERRVRERDGSKGGGFAAIAARVMEPGVQLTLSEVEAFLALKNRDAASLLCAFRQLEDDAYLREALERFPENPEVFLAAVFGDLEDLDRDELIHRLKAADPENALGDYLEAVDAAKSGDLTQMIAAAASGSEKEFDDFSLDACQTDEEAFGFAGYSEAEAKLIAVFGTCKPAVMALHHLLKPLKEVNEAGSKSDDMGVRANVRSVRLSLARQLQSSVSLVEFMIGQNFERAALEADGSPEAQRRLAELQNERRRLVSEAQRAMELLRDPAVVESDWTTYFDRFKESGETAANEWLLERYD